MPLSLYLKCNHNSTFYTLQYNHSTFYTLHYPFSAQQLVCCLELAEEASVVLREHTQVAHLILQVGDALHTETEGIAAIHLAVYAAKLKHIGVDHAAAQYLHPSCVLAEAAAYAAADVA